MIHFHILSLFPEALSPYADSSMLGRAKKAKKIKIDFYNIRDFSLDKRKRTDFKPYGGGPGLVMTPEPIVRAVEMIRGRKKNVDIYFMSPSGIPFTDSIARKIAKKSKHIILVSGHYEGIDARTKKILKAKELSVGQFVLTNGGLPALCIVDAVSRLVPGVLGNDISDEEKRISSKDVYTRPEHFMHKGKKHSVPKVLLSGHHAKIEMHRKNKPGGVN